MLRTTSLRSLILLALAFVTAFPALVRATTLGDLNGLLQTYADEEGATQAAHDARNTLTASADDLVYAVYQYIQANPGFTPQQVADAAAAALQSPDGVKVRADKDKVAARILEAAIIARAPKVDATQINLLLPAVANVNSNLVSPAKHLTAAGKEAVIGKALRATSGLGATIAAQASVLSSAAAGTTPALQERAFTIAALKTLTYKPQVYDPALASTSQATETTKGPLVQLNNGQPEQVFGQPLYNNHGVPPSIAGVRDYVDALLDLYTPVSATLGKAGEALAIAEGVATNPSVAGAVIGGLIKDQKIQGGLPDTAAAGTASLQAIIAKAIADTKLAADIADIVDNALSLFTTDKRAAAITLATGQSAANKGKIASGAVRASNTQAASIIQGIFMINDGKAIGQAGLPAFATAAATGNGDSGTAEAISNTVIGLLTPKATAAADRTAIQAIAINVIKAVAPAHPDSAREVAMGLFGVNRAIGTNPPANYYTALPVNGGTAAREQLAADLAKGAAANYTAAGAAVAGVLEASIPFDSTSGLDVLISAAAIKVAPKASVSIAQKVSANEHYNPNDGGAAARAYASGLALASLSTNAGAIAAGVALTDTTHAGDIVKAVITSNGSTTQNAALNKAAFSIANTAAINVDVEAIADIAQKVGTLLQPSTGSTNPNLPKLSTIGTLATSLAKAINTKPQVTWHNRADELGELAAVLVTDSLAVPGGNTAAALAAIGTSIYKAASAKLLADTGNNAADLKDIAGDVAGAIAQTIAIASTGLNQTQRDALLTDTGTGSLIKLLSTGAKTFASQVSGAFSEVHATRIPILGVYGIVGGSEAIGTNGTATTTGKYEIGYVVDNETPTKNL